jgi:hypothetical protein
MNKSMSASLAAVTQAIADKKVESIDQVLQECASWAADPANMNAAVDPSVALPVALTSARPAAEAASRIIMTAVSAYSRDSPATLTVHPAELPARHSRHRRRHRHWQSASTG